MNLQSVVIIAVLSVVMFGFMVAYINLRKKYAAVKEKLKTTNENAHNVQLLFDTAPLMIEFWSEDFECLDGNPYALSLYELPTKEEYNRSVYDLMPETQPCGTPSHVYWKERLEEIVTGGKALFQFTCMKTGGELVHTDVVAVRMTMNDKMVYVTYSTDVTQVYESIEHMLAAEENNQAKSRFLVRMSHEIRTPLTALLGISEIQLQKPGLSTEIADAFEKIFNAGSNLLNIVNDLLDMSKIEAGKMSFKNERYDVAGMLRDVAQLNLVYLGSKRLDFVIDIDADIPSFLIGDELRIKQMLNNVLLNAFEYTDTGSVTLSVRAEPVPDSETVNLRISIRDTGRGMTKEQKSALFDQYTNFHENVARLGKGTGLGMFITFDLLQLMGGVIDVESEVKIGTTVTILLPQEIAAHEPIGVEKAENIRYFKADAWETTKKQKHTPVSLPHGRVLVVDDVDINLFVAKGLMEPYEMQIETSTSPLATIVKIKNGYVYDIIFMDHMMPEMDGIEATRTLRELGYTNPIVALSANALVGQSEVFLLNGFDDFLTKPIQTAKLHTVLTRYIPAADNADSAEPPQQDVPHLDDYLAIPEIALQIRAGFYETNKNAAADFAKALKEESLNTAQLLAHTIKASAKYVKEDDLADIAEKIELALKKGDIPSENDVLRLTNSLTDVLKNFMP